MMLHTKYQGSRPCGFRREVFFMYLPIKANVKHVTPEAGPFLAQGYNLNKLGIGLLDDTTNQISRPKALWFQTRRFFHVAPYLSLCKTCDPRGQAIFGPRAKI